MTSPFRAAATAALTIAAVAALPPVAAAHPSVFFVTPKKTTDGGATVVDDAPQYAIAQHGYTRVLKETNGLTAGGILDYKYLPSAWRNFAGRPKSEVLAAGATGAQPHATCQGLAALDQAAILAWQGADPFYAYVPWQKTAVGLDDEAELDAWLDVVQTRTGVDLKALADDAAAKTACEGLGGVYYPADTTQTPGSSLASADIAKAVDPLNLQIASLTDLAATRLSSLESEQAKTADLTAANAALTTANSELSGKNADLTKGSDELAAKVAALTAANADLTAKLGALTDTNNALAAKQTALTQSSATPLRISVVSTDLKAATVARTGLAVKVSGAPGAPVVVELKVTPARAAKLGLASRTIGTATQTLDASGSGAFVVSLSKRAAKLVKASGGVPISVHAQIATSASIGTTLKG